ncbi:hypothetical protein [Lentzea sp. CC55]|uniref:hypothetical protein n=1 Tax=Lentzea sp. CC55 TaxID=2884909 RepID=UPI001F36EF37|nr:hypothetical protein [Lentzea sp. CC55]MCG8928096.1 hypothetical protein [Lentzea sp. CC55]
MSGTPIFDELYAEYVGGVSAAHAAAPPVPVTAPREPRYDQFVPQYAATAEMPEWPS